MNDNTHSPLKFVQATKEKDVTEVYKFNVEVFSEGADFRWTLDDIKQEIKSGWELFSVRLGDEIIAALFVKPEKSILHTKHTSIKLEYRGNGHSHKIKDFFEKMASDKKIKKISNVCRADNFRMISLNETHGYKKTTKQLGNGHLVEWEKKLSVGK